MKELILEWANKCLISKGYSLQHPYQVIIEAPWSTVLLFPTSNGNIYLKKTPPLLFIEPSIIQLLADQFHANVPSVIASNNELHCFLMKDAGQTLRKYLNTDFQPNLLCQAIKEFTAVQRSTENYTESLIALGVPDWRLDKLPKLYWQLISQTEFLKAEGMNDEELKILRDLTSTISEQCKAITQYQILETLAQPDFNTNNILFDLSTKKMTLIDLGEIAITHPFFSLHNFILQTTIHHGVKEHDLTYYQLLNACYENWLELATKNELLDAFKLVKKLWPIYGALAYYRLMIAVDRQALKSYYVNRPNQLVGHLREYMVSV